MLYIGIPYIHLQPLRTILVLLHPIFQELYSTPFYDLIDNKSMLIVTDVTEEDTYGLIVWEKYDFDDNGNITFADPEYKIYAEEEYGK